MQKLRPKAVASCSDFTWLSSGYTDHGSSQPTQQTALVLVVRGENQLSRQNSELVALEPLSSSDGCAILCTESTAEVLTVGKCQ